MSDSKEQLERLKREVDEALKNMEPQERLEFISDAMVLYCDHCGGPAGCYCWAEE